MNKVAALVIAVIIILGIIILTIRFNPFSGLFKKTAKVEIGTHVFTAEVAKSESEKEIGLSSRSSIAEDRGMIFIFDTPGMYSFWMKKMQFPLDLIFIKDDKIVTIFKQVTPPPSDIDIADNQLPIYTPQSDINKVLEINSGLVDKYGIKVGDTVKTTL
jgi:uncharacterized membrane protein (UPF0127 family)